MTSRRPQVWSAVKRLDTISPKLLIIFDAHLGWSSSKIFKEATNIFYPTQDQTRYLLASVTMLFPNEPPRMSYATVKKHMLGCWYHMLILLMYCSNYLLIAISNITTIIYILYFFQKVNMIQECSIKEDTNDNFWLYLSPI